jgi:hypothetical protein
LRLPLLTLSSRTSYSGDGVDCVYGPKHVRVKCLLKRSLNGGSLLGRISDNHIVDKLPKSPERPRPLRPACLDLRPRLKTQARIELRMRGTLFLDRITISTTLTWRESAGYSSVSLAKQDTKGMANRDLTKCKFMWQDTC